MSPNYRMVLRPNRGRRLHRALKAYLREEYPITIAVEAEMLGAAALDLNSTIGEDLPAKIGDLKNMQAELGDLISLCVDELHAGEARAEVMERWYADKSEPKPTAAPPLEVPISPNCAECGKIKDVAIDRPLCWHCENTKAGKSCGCSDCVAARSKEAEIEDTGRHCSRCGEPVPKDHPSGWCNDCQKMPEPKAETKCVRCGDVFDRPGKSYCAKCGGEVLIPGLNAKYPDETPAPDPEEKGPDSDEIAPESGAKEGDDES